LSPDGGAMAFYGLKYTLIKMDFYNIIIAWRVSI